MKNRYSVSSALRSHEGHKRARRTADYEIETALALAEELLVRIAELKRAKIGLAKGTHSELDVEAAYQALIKLY